MGVEKFWVYIFFLKYLIAPVVSILVTALSFGSPVSKYIIIHVGMNSDGEKVQT